MPRRVLVVGATSAIASATARLLAAEGDALFLVARDPRRLGAVAEDLAVRGAGRVESLTADLDETDRHAAIVEQAAAALGGLDTFILAHGVLGDAAACRKDPTEVERVLRTNLLGAASLLTVVAERFERQRAGLIVGISSVAGDRGRQSNYVYGASKAGLSTFLQGLRNRLQPAGVHVVTVKPGVVDTPMTAHLDHGLLTARPAAVARGIHRAMRRRRDVAYVPPYWRLVMAVIRAIPEPLFKRLRL